MSVGAQADGAGRVAVAWSCGSRLAGVGLNLDLGWAYGSDLTNNALYGYGGNLTANAVLLAEAANPPTWVTLQRPSGGTVSYAYDSGDHLYEAETASLLTVITTFTDGAGDWWRETNVDGTKAVYPYRADGQRCSLTYMQDPSGNRLTYSYDGSGRLQGVLEPAGRRVTFAYDGNSLLSYYDDWAQRRTTFQYDTASVGGKPLLTTVTGPSGCQTAYGYTTVYTGNPQLNSFTDPNGYQTTYAYYADGRCRESTIVGVGTTRYTYTDVPAALAVTNALGQTSTITYDVTLNAYGAVAPDGLITTWLRNESGLEQVVMRPDGTLTTTTRTSFQYDPANNIYHPFLPLTMTQPTGLTTSLGYDSYGNPTSVTEPTGAITTTLFAYGGSSYDTTGAKRRPQVVIDALGRRTTLSYNALGYVTTIQNAVGAITSLGYDSFYNQISATDPLGHVTTRTFDAAGRVTVVEDALGYRTTLTYDPQNRPLTSTNALDQVTSWGYDSGGRLSVAINPLGYRTSYTYDAFDGVVTAQDALGNVSTTTYDALGRAVAATNALGRIASVSYDVDGRPKTSTTPSGAVTTSNYDAFGRPVGSTNARGYQVTTVYDAFGRALATVDPLGHRATLVFDAYSRVTGAVDPLGNRTTAIFDQLDRVYATQDARGYRTSFTFDAIGQRTAITDANGHAWSNTYDARGSLNVETDPLGARTSYSYDGRGSRVGRVDARNWPTTYTLDALGRTDHLVYRDGTRVTATYDAAGRQTVMGDVTGLTTYAYDAVNRATSVVQPFGRPLTYAYDPVGNRNLLVDQDGGRTTYAYDVENRPASVLNPFNERTTWTWDLLGRNQTQVLANGVTASHTYDPAGRAVGLAYRRADGTWVTAYTSTYDAGGNRIRVDELDGSFYYGYDQSSQLTAELRTGDDPFAPLYNYTYTYDGVGNRRVQDKGTEIIESTYNAADELTGTQTFGPAVASESTFQPFTRAPYSRNAFALNLPLAAGRRYTIEDATLSLVGATGTWDATHRWDLALQSRTASLGVSGTLATSTFQSAGAGAVSLSPGVQVDSDDTPVLSLAVSKVAAPNLLSASGSVRVTSQEKQGETAYGYDANGNTTSEVSAEQSVTYTWDGENQLLTVTTDGETETYAYAATGLRRKKTTGAGTTNFVWDGVNLLAELDGSLATQAQYTDWPGVWGGLSSARRSGSSQFFGFDLSANTRALMDAAAGVTDAYLYSAFGAELLTSGSSTNPMRFGGQVGYYRDSACKLYVRARYYASSTGRFSSPEPAAQLQLSRYSYVGGCPLTFFDPDGLYKVWIGFIYVALGRYHMRIIISGDYHGVPNRWIIFEAGPEKGGLRLSGDYGPLNPGTQPGAFKGDPSYRWFEVNHPDFRFHMPELSRPGPIPDTLVSLIQSETGRIFGTPRYNDIPYDPLGPNSNSYASAIMRNVFHWDRSKNADRWFYREPGDSRGSPSRPWPINRLPGYDWHLPCDDPLKLVPRPLPPVDYGPLIMPGP